MTSEGSVWREVLKAKYGLNEEDGAHFRGRQRASQIWKGAVWGAELLRKGLVWTVRNGECTCFWTDTWLGKRPLMEERGDVVHQDEACLKVAQYWQRDQGWRWQVLANKLSASSLLMLASFMLRAEEVQGDIMGWLKAGRRDFSVKSAYEIASGNEEEENWSGWKMLWKMRASQRVKVFSWLMAHGKLLTNVERWRRRLASDPICVRCHQGEEDTLHAVRDCPWAREVWEVLIHPASHQVFFSLKLEDWVLWLLKEQKTPAEQPRWNGKKVTVCWWQWRWRNAELFQGERMGLQQKFRQLIGSFEEGEEAFKLGGLQDMQPRQWPWA